MTTDQIGRWGSLSTPIVSLTGGSSRILFGSSSSLDNPIDPSFVNAEKIKSLTFVRHPTFKTPKICFHKLWFHHAPYRRKFLLLLILFWTYLTGEKKFVFLLWILFFSGGWVSVFYYYYYYYYYYLFRMQGWATTPKWNKNYLHNTNNSECCFSSMLLL